MTGGQLRGVRLSPQQRHLWQLQQEGDTGPYRARCAVALAGDLDENVLRAALQSVVDGHEILRTRFQCPPGVSLPLQVIAEREAVDLRIEAPGTGESWMESFLNGPGEAGNGPVLRAALVRPAAGEPTLLLDLPALCCDTAGLDNLVREIAAAYAVCRGGAAMDEEPLQYADIAEWQNQLLETEVGEEGRSFWQRQKLPGLNLRLPFEVEPAAPDGFLPRSVARDLTPPLAAAVVDIAAAQGVSPAAFLLAAWGILLGRLGDATDLTLGMAFDGRNYAELETVPGLFARHLPVPLHLDGTRPFAELLARCEERLREHAEWQVSFSWEGLLEEGEALAGLTFPPHCFEHEREPAEQAGGGMRFRTLRRRAATERFRLKLFTTEAGGSVRAEVCHDAARIPADEAGRLLRQWITLVASAAAAPEAPLGDLSALDAAERRQLLVELNESGASPTACFHSLFERRAAEHPERLAVICEEDRRTYGELDARANRLAVALRARGVGPEVLVALCLERSVGMIEGVLATFKAGGAYVPLDPATPMERLLLLLRESGARVLLTEERLAAALSAPGVDTICLDRDREAIASLPAQAPAQRASVENLAYVIFTSGSTGRPKGVAVEHRQLANYVGAVLARLDFGGGSFATVSTFAADLGHTAVFPALASGGCLHVITAERASDPDAFGDYMRRHEIDCLKIVPSHLEALLAAADPASVLPRRRLIVGGEASRREWIERIQELAPGCGIFNHYGPTETTVGALAGAVPAAHGRTRIVPLGRPLAGTRAYVVDPALRPVSTWVSGELCIAGHGVSRGYLDAPAATAEVFVPDPFTAEPGGRLYRTGDLVRHLPGGEIEFLGRIDDQVKIHGFRVEPEEVAAVLRRHPGVRDAAVVAREDGAEKRLAGYWTAASDATAPAAPELAAFLRQHLPPAMVPAALVRLEAFPLTPNGKLDRRRLPAPEGPGARSGEGFIAPRTAAERVLAEIWCDLLGLERVGTRDNFFALGGDSILSIQIVARANKAGLLLNPRHLFQHQTIAELAAVATAAGAIVTERGESTGPVPLTPIQHWFFAAEPAAPHHFNQAVLLALRGPLPGALLEAALRSLLSHHDALRLRFERTPRGWRQIGVPSDGTAPFFHADFTGLPEDLRESGAERVAAELQASLDLARGPLLRAALLDLGPEREQRLLVVIHHLVVDGVSWRILLADLQLACEQLVRGEKPALPARTESFQRWAERLAESAESAWLEGELPFWLDAGQVAVPPLPHDLAGGPEADTVGASDVVLAELDRDATRALLQEAPRTYRTQINDLLLTALAQALAPWVGGRTVRIELEGHGREDLFEDIDLSRTVGWFTSRFPVVLRLPAEADPGLALKSIKEQLRSIPRRGIGYGLLRYLNLQAGPALARLPAPEISFNYLGRFDQVLASSPWFTLSTGARGLERDPGSRRRFLLDIVALVTDGRLQMSWRYGTAVHLRATVERLAAGVLQRLAVLIEHCRAVGLGGYTPSDLPLARLDQEALDRLIDPRQVEDAYPLSPLQQGVLFHTVYAPTSGTYVSPSSCTLEGDLDLAVFAAAWQEVLDRYPILRTAFVWEGVPSPLQLVHRRAEMSWRQLDWRDLPAAEQSARLEALLQDYQREGFALDRPPLMHLTLVRLGERAHALIWCRHHLLLDGWSTSLLIREVLARYQALRRGERLELAPARPYRDYIDWLERQDLREAEAYWQRTLQGFVRPLALSIESEPGNQGEDDREYDKKMRALSIEATTALRDFARQHKLTLNTVLQGAWALLLRLYSGSEDVVYGGVVSGRPAHLPGAESMIGLFINTLPVRIRVPADAPLVPWLAGIQEQQAEQRQYEHSPLVAVSRWSEVPRNLPLFESLFVFENFLTGLPSSDEAIGEDLTIRDLRHQIRNNYPLTLRPVPGSELALHILYEPRRFTAQTVDGILADLELLLDRMVTRSGAGTAALAAAVQESREERRQAERAAYQDAIFRKFKGVRRQTATEDLRGEGR